MIFDWPSNWFRSPSERGRPGATRDEGEHDVFKGIMSRRREAEVDPPSSPEPLFSAANTPTKKDCERRLNALIERGRNGHMFTERMTITPLLAELMLERNSGNRSLKPGRVTRWANLMREGRWLLTSQGISFATTGEMNNGQHRLHAVIEAGRPIDFMVTFGEPRDAFQVIDRQGTRTCGDTLSVAGFDNVNALAGAANILRLVELGTTSTGHVGAMENDEVIRFVESHPGLEDAAREGQLFSAKPTRYRPSPMGASIYLIRSKHHDNADEFFQKLRDGLNLNNKRDPIYVLRRQIPERYQGRGGVNTGVYMAAEIILGWNKWIEKKTCGSLNWDASEPFPTVI